MENKSNYRAALTTLVTVFFFWGFIAASNGVFIPFCKSYFHLDQFQSQLIDFAFYGAYYIGALLLFIVSGYAKMDILNKCSTPEDPDTDWTKQIRYVSLHQVPCFPYEGQSRKVQGPYHNIMTIPIQPESTWSCGYRELFTTHALPFVCTKDEEEWEVFF